MAMLNNQRVSLFCLLHDGISPVVYEACNPLAQIQVVKPMNRGFIIHAYPIDEVERWILQMGMNINRILNSYIMCSGG